MNQCLMASDYIDAADLRFEIAGVQLVIVRFFHRMCGAKITKIHLFKSCCRRALIFLLFFFYVGRPIGPMALISRLLLPCTYHVALVHFLLPFEMFIRECKITLWNVILF